MSCRVLLLSLYRTNITDDKGCLLFDYFACKSAAIFELNSNQAKEKADVLRERQTDRRSMPTKERVLSNGCGF